LDLQVLVVQLLFHGQLVVVKLPRLLVQVVQQVLVQLEQLLLVQVVQLVLQVQLLVVAL
jgi:hypothetical protein